MGHFRSIWGHLRLNFSIRDLQIFNFSKSVRNRPENTPKPSQNPPQTTQNRSKIQPWPLQERFWSPSQVQARKNDAKNRPARPPKPPNLSQNPPQTPPKKSSRPFQVPLLSDFRTFIFLLQICNDFLSLFHGFLKARNLKNRAPVEAKR